MGVKWLHDVPNQRALLYLPSAVTSGINVHNKYYDRQIKYLFYSFTNITSVRACYSEEDIKEGADSIIRLCLKNPYFLKNMEKSYTEKKNSILNIARSYDANLGLKELIRFFMKIFELTSEIFAITIMPELSIDFIEEYIWKEMRKLEIKDEYYQVLTTQRKSYLKIEEEGLLIISTKHNFKELLKEHVKKYFWIENNYVDTKYLDEEYFLNRIKGLKQSTDKDMQEKQGYLNSLDDPKYKRLKVLSNIIEYLGYVHDNRKRVLMETSYYVNKILNDIAKKKKTILDVMYLLKPEEIKNIEKIAIDQAIIDKRRKRMVLYYHNGVTEFYEGDNAIRIEESIAPKPKTDKDEYIGRSTYRGIVNGNVKVVKSVHELNKLDDGDILVTSNTTPDYVPFLHKASAIITEKGGVTCHAAIISREMKIPCIVGVQHIMSALKDGDEVKVDANKGTVKIIKRAKK